MPVTPLAFLPSVYNWLSGQVVSGADTTPEGSVEARRRDTSLAP